MKAGDCLGPYQIVGLIGAGGMGEVYRAHDPRVGRDVAIKVSQERFTERFEREARAIAALNHPNICQLYDVGPDYLVMELIEGEAPKGPLAVEEALAIARQIAEALEAAHEKGIVHRDLKPGNVKVRQDGTVKVLDFGLAKVAEAAAGGGENSPTLTMSPTIAGVILGTVGYMAPEQARGGVVDKRADIWAFGVVLWEMLAGRRLFAGETVSDTLAAVLKTEVDWSLLPAETPGAIRRLLRRCLERDRRRRLADVADARLEIEEAVAGSGAEAPRRAEARPTWIPWAIAGVLMVVAGAGWWLAWRATRPVDYPLTRLSVDLGPNAMTGINLTAAISPDGRRLVFPARAPDGKQQLATRLLDQAQTTLLPGTGNGRDAFFSPDSQWIGFFADGKLKKISVQGGAALTLSDAPFDYGASWGGDGTIIAALNRISGLARVPDAGGTPQPFARLGKGQATHRWPQILPGGQAILFTAAPSASGMENASVEAMSLKTGVTKTLVTGGYFGRYLPANGHSYPVYLHQGVLFGVAFDTVRLELQGTPVPLTENVAASAIQGGGQFDFSAAPAGHGTLVYLEGKGAAQTWPVVWLDSSGKTQPLLATPGTYVLPRFSPDGRRLAVTMSSSSGNEIYVYEVGRETTTRLTFGGHAQTPVWAPDGKHIAFLSTANGSITWIRSDGSGEPEVLLAAQEAIIPWSFSPDGRRLAYHESNSETGFDLWTLPLDTSDPDHPKAGKPEPFLATPSDEMVPTFSPDGRWIAYRANETGTWEVYVRPFPGGRGGKWQISNGGGLYGFWSNNGRELFYETADSRIMVMDYTVDGDSFVPGKPRVWSEKQIFNPGNSNLALAPDGKRFAVFPLPEAAGTEKGSVHVVFLQNFLDELKRRIPGAK